MLYIQSFTLIKSTGARISINRYWWNTKPDCTKHSFINWYIHRHMSIVYFRNLHSEVHDLHNATTFGSHRLQ